jgi:catechol 2,3-dioxygenase-like lactoylglutathione lyase family enzyme
MGCNGAAVATIFSIFLREAMLRKHLLAMLLVCAGFVAGSAAVVEEKKMELGNFSVSLTVKDVALSKGFYEKLGFEQVAGSIEQHWVVLRNGDAKIGLFQGMFEKNTLTFNPGWNASGENLDAFLDIREIQKRLLDSGVGLTNKVDADSTGPAYVSLTDPDGNPILIDQHVPRR